MSIRMIFTEKAELSKGLALKESLIEGLEVLLRLGKVEVC